MQLVQSIGYANTAKDGRANDYAPEREDSGLPFENVLKAEADAETAAHKGAQTAAADDDSNRVAPGAEEAPKASDGPADGAMDADQASATGFDGDDREPIPVDPSAKTDKDPRTVGDPLVGGHAGQGTSGSDNATLVGKTQRASPMSAMVEGLSASVAAQHPKPGSSPIAEDTDPVARGLTTVTEGTITASQNQLATHPKIGLSQSDTGHTLPPLAERGIVSASNATQTAQTSVHTVPTATDGSTTGNAQIDTALLGVPGNGRQHFKDADVRFADRNRFAMGQSSVENRMNGNALPTLASSSTAMPVIKSSISPDQIAAFTLNALEPETTIKGDLLTWDLRPHMGHTHTATLTAQIHRADMPPQISHAIADALRKSPDKPIELTLSPAELGRVRMVMSTQETGMIVTITAERGDTLDLMRRNIDELGKSLSDLGYSDVSFAFEQNDDPSAAPNDQTSDDPADTAPAFQDVPDQMAVPSAPVTSPHTITTGIDMRL